ncbi:glycosyltransferase family 2 protein [Xinfangfangia sp. CPCC 101601]|uniref:Glycosyltransferase family 2 protein n=1 Tax=Pseudogemmobacter lacusdianii TaxID=3069608 RepID=A0ABU0VXJ4_9RHOB|nr:glycosyltransferase family 2 protein [Xinfangfangia sp. CPCC 101601]MDQ2066476.1 glycosyltransferase family 2 protein [Xinfangfangia sp. CPCC 101601]
MKLLSATCQRNEGPFLLEWLAYHRLIGFTDFIVFSNDCEDGSDLLLDRLHELGLLQHHPNPATGGKSVQWQALQHLAKERLTHGADWLLFSDIDEFPMIHAGGHCISDALAAMPDGTDAIALPWRLFGANGIIGYVDSPVTGQFLRSAPDPLYHPIASRSFKTLYRPAAFQKPGVHRPKCKASGPKPMWADGASQALPESFTSSDEAISLPGLTPGRAVIELHHYSLRSVESFLVKVERGLANRKTKAIDLAYWVERNFNTVENRAMAFWQEALAQEIANLRALPGVDPLHLAACDWHRKRAAISARTPEGYQLLCHCIHAAQTAPLPRELALRLYGLFSEIKG